MIGSIHPPARQHPRQQALVAAVRATLEVTFTPARIITPWNGRPYRLPGFQVTGTPDDRIVVRYVHLSIGDRRQRQKATRAMLERYRAALAIHGWQIMLVDERGKAPYLRCCAPHDCMCGNHAQNGAGR